VRDGHGPFCVGPKCQAGNPEHGGLLLDTAGVGDHGGGTSGECDEVEVAQGCEQPNPWVVPESGSFERRFAPWVDGHDHIGEVGDLVQTVGEPLDVVGVVHVRGPVQGRGDVTFGQVQAFTQRIDVEPVQVAQERVDHRVADQVYAVRGDPFRGEVPDRLGAGGKTQVAELVGDPAVDLLGHGVVEGTQARLHVRDGDLE